MKSEIRNLYTKCRKANILMASFNQILQQRAELVLFKFVDSNPKCKTSQKESTAFRRPGGSRKQGS